MVITMKAERAPECIRDPFNFTSSNRQVYWFVDVVSDIVVSLRSPVVSPCMVVVSTPVSSGLPGPSVS